MRRVIAGVILIAFNCIVILAQETDKQSLNPKTPVLTGVSASDTPPDGASFQRLASQFNFRQSRTNNQIIHPPDQSTQPESPFFVMNGAVSMRVLGGRFFIPISGGGASGCFSLDLPQRITNLKEFVPKLAAPEPGKQY